MSSILQDLGDGIKAALTAKKDKKPITKEQFTEYITSIQQSVMSCKQVIDSLGKDTRTQLATNINNISKPASGVQMYKTFLGKLIGKAQSDEAGESFKSFLITFDTIDSTLTKILKQIDKLFEAKTITMYNVNLSQAVVLGIVTEAYICGKFTNLLLNAVMVEMGKIDVALPAYRLDYMKTNVQLVANVVNRSYTKTGMANVDTMISNVIKNNNNIVLVSGGEDKLSNLNTISVSKMNTGTLDIIRNAVPAFNIFGWLGETWVLYQHNKYLKKKAEREWMATHVELLKMEMSGQVNEAEKARLEKIIKTYDSLISKLDKEIADYELSA